MNGRTRRQTVRRAIALRTVGGISSTVKTSLAQYSKQNRAQAAAVPSTIGRVIVALGNPTTIYLS